MSSFATNWIIFGLIMFLFYFLYKYASKPVPKNENGDIILRNNKIFQVLGIIFLLAPLAVPIIDFFAIDKGLETRTGLLIMLSSLAAIISLAGLYFLLYYRNIRLTYNEEKIALQGLLGKEKSLRWSDIEKITFNPLSSDLSVRSHDTTLHISVFMVGMKGFIETMERKTPWRAAQLNLPIR